MRRLIPAMVATGAIATPAWAQDAPRDPGALLAAMTCRDFVALSPEDQITVLLALRAHVSGDPLPHEPLPSGAEAEIGSADGLGGDSGSSGAAGATKDATGEPPGTAAEVEEISAGEPSPEALAEESLTETAVDPKLRAMRTSCEGGPDALATDAMRAADADCE